MVSKHYAGAYLVLMAVVLVPAVFVLVLFFGRATHGIALIAVLIVSAVFPAVTIWVARKMGYPIGQAILCSKCGTEQPMFRKPANRTQVLWGGYTCAKCGAELDARGRERAAQAGPG